MEWQADGAKHQNKSSKNNDSPTCKVTLKCRYIHAFLNQGCTGLVQSQRLRLGLYLFNDLTRSVTQQQSPDYMCAFLVLIVLPLLASPSLVYPTLCTFMVCFSFGLYLSLEIKMYLLTSSNLGPKAEVSVLSIHLPFLITYSVQILTVH